VAAADTYKMVLLKDWDVIREKVKKRFVGHLTSSGKNLEKMQSWKTVMNL